MSRNLVTVLCSNYNSMKWIEGYCESLNSQLLGEFDVVFCDANSTDGSKEFFKKYEFRNGIKVTVREYKDRIGIYDAWNAAVEEADTPYVMNVNTDDRLYPAGLATMLGYAVVFPHVDVFYSRCFVVDDEKHSNIINLYDWPEYSHEKLLEMCLCGPFPLLRREALLQAGPFNQKYAISGDYEMWLRMSKKGGTFMKVKETIGSYFYNPTGNSTNPETFEKHVKEDQELRSMYA